MSTAPRSAAAANPPWLAVRAGTTARVDIAPWPVSDEPEAALTESAASSSRDYTADATRPGDVRYEPIGVIVRIQKLLPGARVALVHGVGARWQAYALVERLIPDVPTGTTLVAAGGFGGFADFYPTLGTTQPHALRLATGSRVVVLGTDVAPYDPDSSDLVRLRVRVADGPWRERIGWIAIGYTGLPVTRVPESAGAGERACMCRLIQFDPARS